MPHTGQCNLSRPVSAVTYTRIDVSVWKGHWHPLPHWTRPSQADLSFPPVRLHNALAPVEQPAASYCQALVQKLETEQHTEQSPIPAPSTCTAATWRHKQPDVTETARCGTHFTDSAYVLLINTRSFQTLPDATSIPTVPAVCCGCTYTP